MQLLKVCKCLKDVYYIFKIATFKSKVKWVDKVPFLCLKKNWVLHKPGYIVAKSVTKNNSIR